MSRTEVLANFTKDTATHALTIIRDDGIYRHLRFKRPDSGVFHFDVITWPGHLAVTGDMGASVFSRLDDMFQFFRDDDGELGINPGYWSEKLVANDGDAQNFSSERFKQLIRERYDCHIKEHSGDDSEKPEWADELWDDLTESVLGAESAESAYSAMSEFSGDYGDSHFEFTDIHDYSRSMLEYDYHLLWRMFAIVYAIRAYDAAKATAGVAA